jgi:hypothetical protein
MKRLLSVVLTIVFLITVFPFAYADGNTVTLTSNKSTVAVGEPFTLTFTTNFHGISLVGIKFPSDISSKFTFSDAVLGSAFDDDDFGGDSDLQAVIQEPLALSAGDDAQACDGSATTSAGVLLTVVVTPKEGTSGQFEFNPTDINGSSILDGAGSSITDFTWIPVNVTVGGGSDPDPTYTATASRTPGTDVTVGDTFPVAVTLTADPATSVYAQAQVQLTYDATRVTPNLTGLTNVSGGSGTLTITAGTGSDVTAGTDPLATIPFTANAAGDAVFSVTDDAAVSLVTKVGGGTVNITPGTDLEVTIAPAVVPVTFETAYKGLPTGTKLVVQEIPSGDASVKYIYDNAEMHHFSKVVSGTTKYYVSYIVETAVTDTVAAGKIAKVTGTAATAATANLNGDEYTNISDSQIAFDLANGYDGYKVATTLTIAIRLAADVNGDGQVTAADAQAIIYAIHHNGALEQAA